MVDSSQQNTTSEKISHDELVITEKDQNFTIEEDNRWLWQKYEFKWWVIGIHLTAAVTTLYCIYHYPFISSYKTTLWHVVLSVYSMFGVCAGAHRFWSHRSFKANALLRTIIAIGYSTSMQPTIETWVRIHRVHHRYADTDADPHNSSRGFFYAHLGWAFTKRSKLVSEKYKQVDLTDYKNDQVAVFFDGLHYRIASALAFIIVAIPVYFWNETWGNSLMAQMIRLFYVNHAVLSINSFAHLLGSRPFNDKIAPVESKLVVFLTNGDGWHNYHHSFPVDYRSAEIGGSTRYDINARLIEFFAKLGWAWDLKTPKPSLVKMTMERKGDGSILSSMIS